MILHKWMNHMLPIFTIFTWPVKIKQTNSAHVYLLANVKCGKKTVSTQLNINWTISYFAHHEWSAWNKAHFEIKYRDTLDCCNAIARYFDWRHVWEQKQNMNKTISFNCEILFYAFYILFQTLNCEWEDNFR